MIDLSLSRITRLIQHTPQTWKAIHVAGTNGKGSICAYLTTMLNTSGISNARFTSPHLVDRWDCIAINGRPISKSLFLSSAATIQRQDQELHLGSSEFELLAATAFDIFQQQSVEAGVVETGMGGRLDATNALAHKAVTVIAKIGMDHQSFLGDTLDAIALQKAGIMRPGVPCVVDASNPPSVLAVLERHAREVGTPVHYPSVDALSEEMGGDLSRLFEPHQLQNLACARMAFQFAFPDRASTYPLPSLVDAIRQTPWPGRLQKVDLAPLLGAETPCSALLDGAHNPQSAEVLSAYVTKHLRDDGPVTWVVAATHGKDVDGVFAEILKPGDAVCAVRFFEPVDGMPWVRAADPSELLAAAVRCGVGGEASALHDAGRDVAGALSWAAKRAAGGPLVIAGSLYLVSSVLRLLRDAKGGGGS